MVILNFTEAINNIVSNSKEYLLRGVVVEDDKQFIIVVEELQKIGYPMGDAIEIKDLYGFPIEIYIDIENNIQGAGVSALYKSSIWFTDLEESEDISSKQR